MFNSLQWLKCRLPWPFYGHRFEIVETYDKMTRKLRCTYCERYFAMSDRHCAILPWDDDFEQITRGMYGIPRSKL
jgi:hypothetical protein